MSKTTFVTASSLSAGDAARHWREVALNPEENLVIRALQLLDPSIRQVAYVGPDRAYRLSDRGGMVVRRADSGERIPIGSLGDGAWRLLALALALTRSAGGTLLIDEVDTGFHYSIMTAMWKMVLTTAERLDVQVFATTHSQDCVSALATICTDEDRERIGLHRIEADAERAVAFSAKEIRIAAQRGIEVR